MLQDKKLRCLWDTAGETRKWGDVLVTSSLLYGATFFYAIYTDQPIMAFLCVMTSSGSILYHRHRESMYFNLDNIFAMGQLLIYGWSLFLAFTNDNEVSEYLLIGVIGIPVAIFLLVYCGMPAEISWNESKGCCIRSSSSIYDFVHSIWHIVSGLGPGINIVISVRILFLFL